MTRHLFPGDLFLIEGTDNAALLGANVPFNVWTERVGGTNVTSSCLTDDGATSLTAVADDDGKRPWFLGPDTAGGIEFVTLYIDAGIGDRYPVYAVDMVTSAMEAAGAGGSLDVEAVRDTMAATLVQGPNVTITPSDASNTITISATTGLDAEAVRDVIGAALIAGTGVTITPDDAGETITITATGGGGATDTEVVRDTIAAALVGGSGITITHNDAANTITIAANLDAETVRDTIAAALVGGTGITVTADDAANTITISASGGGSTDPEIVRDTIAAALVAGSGISITASDIGDTITIAATGGGGGGANSDAFVTVATYNTPTAQKDNADFTCTSTNAHVQIQAALDLMQANPGGGEVILLPGTYNVAATIVVGLNGNNGKPVMLRFEAGAGIVWQGVTGRTPIVSVQGWLCDIFNPSIQGSGTKGNGIGIQLGGTGNTVHGCTVWSPKISACDTAVEFGIVGTSSSGECNVVGGRLSNCKTGVQSNAFVNYVELCFISGVDVGVRQSADRSSGKVVVSNTTINEWAEVGIEILRGRGSTFHNLWMEHTSAQGGFAPECIRIAPTGTNYVANPTFSGVCHLHPIDVSDGTPENYGIRLSGNVEGLYAEHIEFTDELPATALIRQDSTHVGTRNIIKEISIGDPIPSGWTYSKLLSNASSTGVVVIQECPAPAGSSAGLTVGGTTPLPSRATYHVDRSGSPNTALYWAKRDDGHIAAMAPDTATTSGLKTVLESLANNNVSFEFGPGRYHFLDAPVGNEAWAGVQDHASYVSFTGLAFFGAGLDTTFISNRSNYTAGADTEPFSFSNCQDITIRDLRVEGCGYYRTTTDALDFDQGSRCLIERVAISRSRSRAIVFDGGDAGKNATGNTVRDVLIQGCPERPQLSLVAGGTLSASTTYRYGVSWTDRDLAGAGVAGETKISELATITTDSTNKSVRVYLKPGPYSCTERRIYRAPAGSSAWVRVTTVADNTTTQYVDTGGAGTSVTMPVSNRSTIPQAGIEFLGASSNKVIGGFIDGVGDDPVGTSGFGVHMIRKGSGTTYAPSNRNELIGVTVRGAVSNSYKINGGEDNIIANCFSINPGTVAAKVPHIRFDGTAGVTITSRNKAHDNRLIDDQDANSPSGGKTTSNPVLINNVGTVADNEIRNNTIDPGASTPLISDLGTNSIIAGNVGIGITPIGSRDFLLREIGDTTIPANAPTGALLFTKLPIALKKWQGVGVVDASTLTTSTVGIGDSAFSAVASGPTVENQEIVIVNATTTQTMSWDGFNRTAWDCWFLFRIETNNPTGNVNIFSVYDSVSAVLFKISLNTTRQPQLRNTAGTSVWNGTALTLGQTYLFAVSSTGIPNASVRVYTLADVIHTQSGAQTLTYSTNMDRLVLGRENTIAYGPGYFSRLAVLDTPGMTPATYRQVLGTV